MSASPAQVCTGRLPISCPIVFPVASLADITSRFLILLFDIFQWRFESTLHHRLRYALASTHIPCHSSLFKHRPLSTLLFVHAGRQDQAYRRTHQARAQRQQLAGQQQSQPKAHKPAPLRALWPRQASLSRCRGLVRVRHRPLLSASSLPVDKCMGMK